MNSQIQLVIVVSLGLIAMVASQLTGGSNNGMPECSGEQGKNAIKSFCDQMKNIPTDKIPTIPMVSPPDQMKKIQDCMLQEAAQSSGTCFQMPGGQQMTAQQLCSPDNDKAADMGCCYLKQFQPAGGSSSTPNMPDPSKFVQQCIQSNSGLPNMG